MAEFVKLKYYFGTELAELLAKKITSVYKPFYSKQFIHEIDSQVDSLELKDRVNVITTSLHKYLPKQYKQAISILIDILGPENKKETGMFKTGYWIMPIARFVEVHGVKDYETSIHAIYEITKRHTGEFAIRPFILQKPYETAKLMKTWAQDNNLHVRRLASEGLRPKLPWATRLDIFIDDPKPVFDVLEIIKTDSSKFVQKSVANNINDYLKLNYKAAINLLHNWSQQSPSKATRWIIKHALRKRIKLNDRKALNILKRLDK